MSAEIVTVISGFVTPVNDPCLFEALLFASTATITTSFFPLRISISKSIGNQLSEEQIDKIKKAHLRVNYGLQQRLWSSG